MAFTERSTIRELIARYKLEPSLRDVYVEGSKDRSLLSWYCASNDIRDVSVREIDNVEVPSSLIIARGLRPGRRGAVITLGLELCEALGPTVPQVMCIADRDGEDPATHEQCTCVYFTDWACREMYFFDHRVVGKLLSIGAGQSEADPTAVLKALTPALTTLFAVRQTNLALGLGLEWLSFDRCCQLTATREIRFDLDDFVRRFLNKGGKLASLADFAAKLENQLRVAAEDPRLRMNGHDFTALLAWYLDKSGLRRRSSTDEIAEMLAVATENEWLTETSLFRKVLGFARN